MEKRKTQIIPVKEEKKTCFILTKVVYQLSVFEFSLRNMLSIFPSICEKLKFNNVRRRIFCNFFFFESIMRTQTE